MALTGFNSQDFGSIGYSNDVTINVTTPISVSKSLSDDDIARKARMISKVVGREFAKMTGGRMA